MKNKLALSTAILAIFYVAIAPANVTFNLPDGHSFTVKSATSGDVVLHVNPNGEFLVNGKPHTEIVGKEGPQGQPGLEGPQGFKGDTGATGSKGDKGYQGIQGIHGLKGDTGIQGPKDDTGAAAADCKTILNGTTNPTTKGKDGDFYINTASNTLFGPKASGAWPAGTSLIGPQGIQGIQGVKEIRHV